MSYLSDCARVYLPTGKFAHLLPPGDLPSGDSPALCYRRPLRLATWAGTGSQGEYERAASLPLCSWCQHLAVTR